MKKFFVLSVVAILVFVQLTSFKKDTVYKKVYFKDQVIENELYKVTLSDIVGLEGELKFKLTVENLSDDFIMYKPNESALNTGSEKFKASEKYLMVSPKSKSFRVLNFKGKQMNLIKEFKFNLQGLYTLSTSGVNVGFPNFTLPATLNEITENDIKLSLVNVKKESAETQVKFKVTYEGDNALLLSPSMLFVKMPDGKSYANEFRKEKPSILLKGESDNVRGFWQRMPGGSANDMQMVEMKLDFGQVFKEITPILLGGIETSTSIDEALTIEKNK